MSYAPAHEYYTIDESVESLQRAANRRRLAERGGSVSQIARDQRRLLRLAAASTDAHNAFQDAERKRHVGDMKAAKANRPKNKRRARAADMTAKYIVEETFRRG